MPAERDIKSFLRNFEDYRIDSAISVVGPDFVRNPFYYRHPLSIFTDRSITKYSVPLDDTLTYGAVELVGQGPLPIELGGEQYMAQMAAFRIDGLPSSHSAFVLTYGEVGRYPQDQTVYTTVEDHVALVMQHGDGGSAWHDLGERLHQTFHNGGAVVLLPQIARYWSEGKRAEIDHQIGMMMGMDNIVSVPQFRRRRYMDPQLQGVLFRHADKSALKNAVIVNWEQVILPWSDEPFLHVEIADRSRFGDLHHLWLFGPFLGMDDYWTRVHSACSSSEIFGAVNCDCPEQLDMAMAAIAKKGSGAVFYMDQEARGHGLWAKVQTWGFNIEHKVDLLKAFHAAGISEDVRAFNIVAEVFNFLRIKGINLLSNNIAVKENGLSHAGVNVKGRISVAAQPKSEWCVIDHAAKQNGRGDDFDHDSGLVPQVQILKRR